MPYKDIEIEKVYFTIGEVAEMILQATSAVRFWEMEFPWLSPKKGKKGNRKYTRKDILIVENINYLLNTIGMTCKGVRQAHEYGYVENLINLYKDGKPEN
jgi:DNA-binding transcriptional MerR regulator